ncbi:LamG-like jellyroll fold domain-containing protein [Tichowtungia aerotolerans]|uniref:LamG domain-containing protein n=1 Tax=Tichowtungia aerotolerans TaxID=2697043 RepID=A0A6P1ME93_9BACT|nr:LamG-like jellyroll fold domain-containing protein [Tichowtungia aerotolerans]QHI69405.1 hypothetical protein GT409_08045 [Tichowtungia aerotolerans]
MFSFLPAVFSVHAGLIAHWNFDDGTCSDVVGGLHGTPNGNVSFVDSGHPTLGKAVAFGTVKDSDYIALGDLSSLGVGSGSFTLSLRMKHAAQSLSGEVSPLFWDSQTGSAGKGYDGIKIALRKGSDGNNAGRVFASVGGPDGKVLLKGRRVDDDEWHLVVIRYDSDTDELMYFEDGLHVYSRDAFGVYVLNRSESGKKTLLGNGFGGMIDDVRVYDTALSDEELAGLL